MVRATRKNSPKTHDTYSHAVACPISSAPTITTDPENRKSETG